MVRLQQVKKYFAVILNVKDNIEKSERLERFIKKPEKVFEQQRLSEHQNHICTYVKENLAVENVDIVCIHAMAAFLSTKPEYAEYSQRLWELSRVEEIYYLIADDIKNNGQKRRVSTFFDGAVNFISENESKIFDHQRLLSAEIKFMYEKNRDLEKIFDSWKQDGQFKIESECATLYFAIKQWIPYFVDNYAVKDDAQSEWNKKFNSKHIETTMKGVIDEIILDLQERLKEFNQQYKYDIKGIKIDLDGLEINDINEGQFGRFIKWAGVAVGAVGAVGFLFNPLLGLAATGVGILANVAADWVSEQEKREFQKQREDLKASLLETVEEKQRKTIKIYKKWLHDDLAMAVHKQTFDRVSTCIKGLHVIAEALAKSNLEIHNLKNQIKEDLSEWNHSALFRDKAYRRSDSQSGAHRTPRRYISPDEPCWLL